MGVFVFKSIVEKVNLALYPLIKKFLKYPPSFKDHLNSEIFSTFSRKSKITIIYLAFPKYCYQKGQMGVSDRNG